MRWKLLRRRLSLTAPRVAVRRQTAWPLRWAAVALALGFSAALALWAFQTGKALAGLDHDAKVELVRLREQAIALRAERDKAQAVADSAESLLKTERTTEERLTEQLRRSEADQLALRADLGFFRQLIPAAGLSEGLSVRAFHAELQSPGHLRYRALVVQGGRQPAPFVGRVELTVAGTKDGQPWTAPATPAAQPLSVRQYARLEGLIDCPPQGVVKTLQIKVTDAGGVVRALQTATL